MKKATSKRDRKYGKKDETTGETVKPKARKKKVKKEEPVRIMVDYAVIRNFSSRKDAEEYINEQHKEADKALRPRSSFIFI